MISLSLQQQPRPLRRNKVPQTIYTDLVPSTEINRGGSAWRGMWYAYRHFIPLGNGWAGNAAFDQSFFAPSRIFPLTFRQYIDALHQCHTQCLWRDLEVNLNKSLLSFCSYSWPFMRIYTHYIKIRFKCKYRGGFTTGVIRSRVNQINQ